MTGKEEIRGFDFHCHVDLYPDPTGMIASCTDERIITLAVTTTPKAWPQNRRWAQASPYVHTAVGLHPELVGERFQEIDLLERCIAETRLIGEIGLDGSPQHRTYWSRQKDVFGRALTVTQGLGGRVVSIHSRRASSEALKMISDLTTPDQVLCVLHWFSGSKAEARKAVSQGCYFSINAQMLKNERGLALVREIPQDRLLTETDGPFTMEGDRKCVPSDVIATAKQLAQIRNMTVEEMAQTMFENAQRIFEFAGISI